MSLIYKKMDLFDAPKGSILVHAVNAQGVWGSGIAKEFKEKFPKAFLSYEKESKNYGMMAEFDFCVDNEQAIGSLFTSKNYGLRVDSPDEILVNTTLVLNGFTQYLDDNAYEDISIYSNKFNSGLFNVPWEKTEAILKVFVKRYNLNWTVCEK